MSDSPAPPLTPVPQMTDAERLTDLRRQVLEGKEISIDEYRLVIASVRRKRAGDVEVASTKAGAQGVVRQAKNAKEVKSLAELLGSALAKKKEQ